MLISTKGVSFVDEGFMTLSLRFVNYGVACNHSFLRYMVFLGGNTCGIAKCQHASFWTPIKRKQLENVLCVHQMYFLRPLKVILLSGQAGKSFGFYI